MRLLSFVLGTTGLRATAAATVDYESGRIVMIIVRKYYFCSISVQRANQSAGSRVSAVRRDVDGFRVRFCSRRATVCRARLSERPRPPMARVSAIFALFAVAGLWWPTVPADQQDVRTATTTNGK